MNITVVLGFPDNVPGEIRQAIAEQATLLLSEFAQSVSVVLIEDEHITMVHGKLSHPLPDKETCDKVATDLYKKHLLGLNQRLMLDVPTHGSFRRGIQPREH